MTKVAGLLLAAGASVRMGQPKQLLRAGGQTLLARILVKALNSDLDRVVLVLGHQARMIKEAIITDLHHPKLKIIENRNYQKGISSSIIAGLSEVEDAYDHVMILLADMPHITSELINLLIHQYLASRLPLGAITLQGRRSHPVIIGRPFYDELHHLQGDVGARDLFLRYSDRVCLVEAEEDYDDIDIDTPEDFLDFKKSMERQIP